MRETLQEFKRRRQFPADRKKEYAIRKSWGVYDFFKFYRKNKPSEEKWILTESQYFAIFRRVNELLVDTLIMTGRVEFPYRMGELILVKREGKTIITPEGKRKQVRRIDWDKTLTLWYDDAEAYKNKTLIYYETPDIFVKYLKRKAVYKNKYFYDFKPSRDIARRANRESVVSLIINRELVNQIKGLYDG